MFLSIFHQPSLRSETPRLESPDTTIRMFARFIVIRSIVTFIIIFFITRARLQFPCSISFSDKILSTANFRPGELRVNKKSPKFLGLFIGFSFELLIKFYPGNCRPSQLNINKKSLKFSGVFIGFPFKLLDKTLMQQIIALACSIWTRKAQNFSDFSLIFRSNSEDWETAISEDRQIVKMNNNTHDVEAI